MIKSLFVISVLLTIGTLAPAEELDIFGYFEPQYNGLFHNSSYSQFHSNKLRVDIQSSAASSAEVGADLIGVVYSGKKHWNILDFLLQHIVAAVPSEMLSTYEFSYRDTIFLDNAYARFALNRFALTVGKQQISLGPGYFSNPTDVFNDKDALDPTYEQSGHTAVRVDMQLRNRLKAILFYAPDGADWGRSSKLLRLKAGLKRFDVGLALSERETETVDYHTMEATAQSCLQVGGDIVGEVAGYGVWGEGAYGMLEHDSDLYEFIVGGDYTLESGLYWMVEYHRNSQARSDHRDYDLNDWLRFFSGQSRTMSRDQAYVFARYPVRDVVALGGSSIVSISDGSVALVPTLEYSLYENTELTLMLNFFIGSEGKAYSSRLGNGGFLRANIYF